MLNEVKSPRAILTVVVHCMYSIMYVSSMSSLLTHNVAHSTRHSFRPKTNKQPVFESCVHLSKSCQKLSVILENKVV